MRALLVFSLISLTKAFSISASCMAEPATK